MTSRIVTAFAVLLAASTVGGAANAQARAGARPAAGAPAASAARTGVNPTPGQPLPGVCYFSSRAAIGTSAVGKAIDARMEQLQRQASAELGGERTALETDAKAFDAKRASLTAEQQQQQAGPINARVQAFQQKGSLREQELRATLNKQIEAVGQRIGPIFASVSAARGCSVVLNGDGGLVAANPAMDLTPAVVQQLNSQISTVTFDRENLSAQAAAAAARR